MRRHSTAILAAVAAAGSVLVTAASAAAGMPAVPGVRAAVLGGKWGTAIEVPGTAALNAGGSAWVRSVSCASAGNCSAGGFYVDRSGDQQAFVAGETNGSWRRGEEVPGIAALNQGGNADLTSVSCSSAGSCSAGGRYQTTGGVFEAFVVGETNGTWRTAVEVPGTGALNRGGNAGITSVSCASAGNCSAGGFYTNSSAHLRAFVVGETNGTWGRAEEVPGTGAINLGDAEITSVSCASPGNCSAGGLYPTPAIEAFVVGERNGTWGTAVEVPGIAALSQGGFAEITSVSCGSAGDCSAGGFYLGRSIQQQAFVVGEKKGIWWKAIEAPGTAGLNRGEDAEINSVSCGSAGNCSAAGDYRDVNQLQQAFVADETNGTWGKAEQVPGTAGLNQGGDAETISVSCASAGNCSAGGFYNTGRLSQQAFVVGETNGIWGKAQEVPGIAGLNQGGAAGINSLSCGSVEHCSAGGFYTDRFTHYQAFVVGETY